MSFDLAKHGLNLKKGFKTNLVSFLENKKTGMKRGEGEKEKKRKRKRGRREEEELKQKGMELLTLSMDPWFCLVNGYLLYPNLGFVRISS